jgi:hypothetical protein
LREVGWGFGVRAGRWKLIEAIKEGRRELYNLERDPHERDNLSASRPERLQFLSRRLAAWREAELENASRRQLHLDPQDAEALRTLGYLDEEEPAEGGDPVLPRDPAGIGHRPSDPPR